MTRTLRVGYLDVAPGGRVWATPMPASNSDASPAKKRTLAFIAALSRDRSRKQKNHYSMTIPIVRQHFQTTRASIMAGIKAHDHRQQDHHEQHREDAHHHRHRQL